MKTVLLPKTFLACSVAAVAICATNPIASAQTDAPQSPAPQKSGEEKAPAKPPHKVFVAARDPERKGGATYNPLTWESVDSNIYSMHAHVGVGETFPVRPTNQPKLFDATVTSGDDDHVVLEIRSEKSASTVEVRRVKTTYFDFEGHKYAMDFPWEQGRIGSNPPPSEPKPTDQALINVFLYLRDSEVLLAKNTATRASTEKGGLLYSMKFDGGSVGTFLSVWKTCFPKDNFVVTDSATNVHVPAFEIRNVRLTELGRSVAFLSEGTLTVEAVDKDPSMPGNIWRIGTPLPAGTGAVRMRAVSVPPTTEDPTADRAILDTLVALALKAEKERTVFAEQVGKSPARAAIPAVAKVLPEQDAIVLIGSDESISAMESVIQATKSSVTAQAFKKYEAELEQKSKAKPAETAPKSGQ